MSYLFSDPKFWLLVSFIVFVILMIKPFKSMMIGGLDSKKTRQTVKSKEKNSIDRIKQVELSAIQSIKSQASIELNAIIKNYFSNLSDENRTKILDNSVIDLKSVN